MKKNILIVAIAILALGITACSKEEGISTNNNNSELRVKSVSDLIGTSWIYSIDTIYADIDGDTLAIPLDMQFGLDFDSTYAHLSFPENVIGYDMVQGNGEYSMQEIQSKDYLYSYDPSTLTGYLVADGFDDNGTPETFQIAFTYDYNADAILINMDLSEENSDDTTPFTLYFHRNI